MGATVAAALKKIAVAILTNPKVLKTIGGIVLGILIIIIMPIVAVVSIFSGDVDIDYGRLDEIIVETWTRANGRSWSYPKEYWLILKQRCRTPDLKIGRRKPRRCICWDWWITAGRKISAIRWSAVSRRNKPTKNW